MEYGGTEMFCILLSIRFNIPVEIVIDNIQPLMETFSFQVYAPTFYRSI